MIINLSNMGYIYKIHSINDWPVSGGQVKFRLRRETEWRRGEIPEFKRYVKDLEFLFSYQWDEVAEIELLTWRDVMN